MSDTENLRIHWCLEYIICLIESLLSDIYFENSIETRASSTASKPSNTHQFHNISPQMSVISTHFIAKAFFYLTKCYCVI